MTRISVVAGNVPLALALEPGSSVHSSLGAVVIGGILSSLFLTLIVVPIMYMRVAPEHFHPTHSDAGTPDGTKLAPNAHQQALPARA